MTRTNKRLVLAAMVFVVTMTFIDQTIVAIAIPDIDGALSLSATGAQWLINGYLLALSALFALGGRLGDVLGRRRMVVAGVIGFAIASAFCGFTATGSVAQPWIIGFRMLQGAGAALLFPAAVGIVVAAFPLREQGRARASTSHDVQLAFAHSTQTAFYVMAGVMAVGFLVSLVWVPRGRLERAARLSPTDAPAVPS